MLQILRLREKIGTLLSQKAHYGVASENLFIHEQAHFTPYYLLLFQLRTTKSRFVRERLFAMEKGVCQVCKFDSHSLFAKVIALRKKDRRSALEVTHFKELPVAQLRRIIMDPKEGQVRCSCI